MLHDLPFLNDLPVLLIDAISVALAATMILHNTLRDQKTYIFIAMAILMLAWVNFAYFARLVGANDPFLAEQFLRIAWVATPPFFGFLHLVALHLVERHRQYRTLSIIILISSGLLGFTAIVSDFVIGGITFAPNFHLDIIYGKYLFVFLGITFVYMLASVLPLILVRIEEKRRKRVLYYIIGLSVFFVMNLVFNITLPIFFNVSHLYYFGDYSTVFLLGFTAFAVFRHHLFNVQILTAELLVFTLWVFLFARTLVAYTLEEKIVGWSMLAATVFLGVLLIRAAIRELAARRQVEHIAQDLAKANSRLLELDTLKSEFISLASHQLRTPITPIKWYASLILDGTYGKVTSQVRDAVQNMYASSHSLALMVEDFLNVSRIEQGRLTYTFESVDVSALLREILVEHEPVVRRTGLKLVTRLNEKTLYLVSADKEKLRQVFGNLLDNATKYTEKGSIAVSVKKMKNSIVRITIADTGIGIAPETLPKLFSKFERGPNAKRINSSGSGIGLYIASEVIKAHQGTIWAESEGEDKGSTFIVELPLITSKTGTIRR